MIRATIGVWANYATTAAFQIVFALRYGSGTEASVFVIVFGVAIGVGGVITASVQSVIVPRLLTPANRLVRPAVRLVGAFTLLAAAALLALWLEADGVANVLAAHTHIPRTAIVQALRAACPFIFLEVLSGELIAINLAIGRRFAPAVAPALPSVVAATPLALAAPISVPTLFTILWVGALAEVAFLVAALAVGLRGRWRTVSGHLPHAGVIAFATAAQLILLTLLPAFERVMASLHSPDGAAHYNYALRSLAVVQQLVIGGWLLSSLGDWSEFARANERRRFRASLLKTTASATLLLVLAASIAIVAGQKLVALVYEHGAFTSRDTRVVTSLILLALAGFCAEGIGLVLSQALLAHRRNGSAIGIGIFSFIVRVTLIVLLAHAWGVRGVAIAYSISAVAALLLEILVVGALALAARSDLARLGRSALVALGTLATAGACVLARPLLPSAAQAVLVLGSFAALIVIVKPEIAMRFGHA